MVPDTDMVTYNETAYSTTTTVTRNRATVTVVVSGVDGAATHTIPCTMEDTGERTTIGIAFCDLPFGNLIMTTYKPIEFPDLPIYEVPAWLKEQRRKPKNKRHVPAFKPGQERSYRRGAY